MQGIPDRYQVPSAICLAFSGLPGFMGMGILFSPRSCFGFSSGLTRGFFGSYGSSHRLRASYMQARNIASIVWMHPPPSQPWFRFAFFKNPPYALTIYCFKLFLMLETVARLMFNISAIVVSFSPL